MTDKSPAASQRVVRFDHFRCGDYDSTEYLIAPAGMIDEEVTLLARLIKAEVVADAEQVKAERTAPGFHPDYKAHPDLTVREVQERHAAEQADYKAWKESQKHLTRSFAERLVERGLTSLYDGSGEGIDLHWGHHHGLDLNYGPPKGDGFGY